MVVDKGFVFIACYSMVLLLFLCIYELYSKLWYIFFKYEEDIIIHSAAFSNILTIDPIHYVIFHIDTACVLLLYFRIA